MGFMDFFKKKNSGNVAKDRLKLLLISDRADCSPYCEISLIKSVSERRNYFEPGTDEYYNRKANTSSANTIGNDTGRTSRGIECYPAGTIELGERC